MSSYRLLIGDCREMLRTLPDESVHCVVTSPPYWGLRDYGVPPTVWGGDPACEHEWGPQERGRRKDILPAEESTAGRLGTHERATGLNDGGRFCVRCGAWRGQLGLEPTPELYVEHMVEVFREVRRVLRRDGTLWLNLGDTYNAYNGNRGIESRYAGDRRKIGEPMFPPGHGLLVPTLKPKDLIGIPWRVAFALQADGWYLRCDIVWAKSNPMPESVRDRPTKAHEYVFMFARSERYYYDSDAIREPLATDPRENYPARARITGRGNQPAAAARGNDRGKSGGFPPRRSGNKARKYGEDRDRPGSHLGAGVPWEDDGTGRNARSVWNITTRPYPGAHFATFPPELAEKCILAGCPKGGTVLDPFAGSGTTGMVATGHGRNAILIELNPDYAELIRERIGPMLEVSHAA